jgi:hypothetical protein
LGFRCGILESGFNMKRIFSSGLIESPLTHLYGIWKGIRGLPGARGVIGGE